MSGGVGPGGEDTPPVGEPLPTGAAVEPVDATVTLPIADHRATAGTWAPTAMPVPGAGCSGAGDVQTEAGAGAVGWSAAEGTRPDAAVGNRAAMPVPGEGCSGAAPFDPATPPGAVGWSAPEGTRSGAVAAPVGDVADGAWGAVPAADTGAEPAPGRQAVADPPASSSESPPLMPALRDLPGADALAGHAAGAAAGPEPASAAAFPATAASGGSRDAARPAPADMPPPPAPDPAATALAGGLVGPSALTPLLVTALSAMTAGARRRGGPLPRGGPAAVDADVRRALATAAVGDLPASAAADGIAAGSSGMPGAPTEAGGSVADGGGPRMTAPLVHGADGAAAPVAAIAATPFGAGAPEASSVLPSAAGEGAAAVGTPPHLASPADPSPGPAVAESAPTPPAGLPGAPATAPLPAADHAGFGLPAAGGVRRGTAAGSPHPAPSDPAPHSTVPHPHAAPDAPSAFAHPRPATCHVAEPLPAHGIGAHQALAALTEALAHGTADPADPFCAGHLHCPPLAVAVVADAVAAALNPSLDSWDQAPAATALETEVVAALAGLVGFDPAVASGTVTTGGTESNLLGLLLARDRSGPGVGRHRVLCSDAAHFSVRRSAVLLGLGDDAVVPVATGLDHRIDPGALDAVCRRVAAANDLPTAIVATAGTTDFGAVDPLAACADVAREHGAWLHVDAAYGGGALFSDRLAPLLHGLDRADSVGLDLHKLGWQPVAAGMFLVRDRRLFAPLTQRAKYLNPADDEDAGFPSLLGHSPRTTRRADVFKIAVTLRALGRAGLGALVDRCHELARYAGERIDRDPGPGALELTAEPVLTTVVFRYVPEPRIGESPAARSDTVNAELRRRLLAEGRAVVGRTDIGPGPGAVRLKLTLLNPHAVEHDVDAVLRAVIAAGRAVEREL